MEDGKSPEGAEIYSQDYSLSQHRAAVNPYTIQGYLTVVLPLYPEARDGLHFFPFFPFLYRRSSAIISWSSIHVLVWIIGKPYVQGAFQRPFSVAVPRTRPGTLAISTMSTDVLMT